MTKTFAVHASVFFATLFQAPDNLRSKSQAQLMWRLALTCLMFCVSTGLLPAQVVSVTNRLANGYSDNPFPSACSSGYTLSVPSGYHIERPHVMYNITSQQWVLWAHYDSADYSTAEAVVATSSSQCGPYTMYAAFRPLGYESRDENIFQDDNGTGWFITASNKNGGANDTIAVFRMTPDYLGIDSTAGVTWAFENAYREAPAIGKTGGVYFLLTSQAAGWFPSQGGYGTASSMLGPWSGISWLGNASTFGGQQSDLIKVRGSATTSYYMTLDHLGGNTARDDGELWLPVTLNASNRTATMEWYTNWSIDLGTGLVTTPALTNYATSGTATADLASSNNPAQLAIDGNYGTEWIADAASFPTNWQVDLQQVRTINEVDISWFMVKGSEAYYQYKIDYSDDGVNWTSIDRTGNQMYGFTSDTVNFSARYIRIELVNAVLQNNPNNWYTPQLWEVKLLKNP